MVCTVTGTTGGGTVVPACVGTWGTVVCAAVVCWVGTDGTVVCGAVVWTVAIVVVCGATVCWVLVVTWVFVTTVCTDITGARVSVVTTCPVGIRIVWDVFGVSDPADVWLVATG